MNCHLYSLIMSVATACICPLLAAGQTASPTPSNMSHTQQETTPQIINEPDQTDTLAIPLDNSEEEEDQEMDQLEALQTKLQEKKEAEHKTGT